MIFIKKNKHKRPGECFIFRTKDGQYRKAVKASRKHSIPIGQSGTIREAVDTELQDQTIYIDSQDLIDSGLAPATWAAKLGISIRTVGYWMSGRRLITRNNEMRRRIISILDSIGA